MHYRMIIHLSWFGNSRFLQVEPIPILSGILSWSDASNSSLPPDLVELGVDNELLESLWKQSFVPTTRTKGSVIYHKDSVVT